jgi:hypothetical protein
VVAKAGSVAVFSSLTMHSSGANIAPRLRRAFISQYSSEPVLTADRTLLWANGKPPTSTQGDLDAWSLEELQAAAMAGVAWAAA